VVSSELEEVLGLSHRVLVMSGGRQQGVLSREEATPQAVMALAVRNTFVDDSDHVDHVTEPTDLESPMSEFASGPLNTAAGTRQEG
jgi:ABC-type sulfate/molybdate transport systems ATPase subunit